MNRHWLLVAVIAGMPLAAFAEEAAKGAAPAADPARVQQIVSQVCAACHGADGNSPSSANPNLAGQPADYITLQLAHFKAGIRTSPVMQPMAATLSDADMHALGAYFAQQKPKGLTAKDATTVKMAQQLYRGGDAENEVPACASCHSPDGGGIPKNFPRVGGQHADYIYAQLQAFKLGQRGNDKEGKDINGRIMATIASRLTDAQMKAVADYVAGLR
jgi:cytochrome c553